MGRKKKENEEEVVVLEKIEKGDNRKTNYVSEVFYYLLGLVIGIVLIFGIPKLSMVVLLICILAALGDEVGHELIPNVTQNMFLNLFFEYRFVMKVVILLLAVCGVFNLWIFVCFISFEIAYELAKVVFEN